MAGGKIKKKGHPRFKRPNVGRTKRSRLKDVWRRPRGTGNKQRQKLKQAGALPSIGYRNPGGVRGVHPSGLREVLVYNPEQLGSLNKEVHAVRIASSVGAQKRRQILETADKLGLRVLNRPATNTGKR